ncbi:hypothetical protein SRHO_G00029630 [Serrasalmus rhombeus]
MTGVEFSELLASRQQPFWTRGQKMDQKMTSPCSVDLKMLVCEASHGINPGPTPRLSLIRRLQSSPLRFPVQGLQTGQQEGGEGQDVGDCGILR